MFVCVECGSEVDHLYKNYGRRNIRMKVCDACGLTADRYMGMDLTNILIEAILLKRSVYRHLIWNAGGEGAGLTLTACDDTPCFLAASPLSRSASPGTPSRAKTPSKAEHVGRPLPPKEVEESGVESEEESDYDNSTVSKRNASRPSSPQWNRGSITADALQKKDRKQMYSRSYWKCLLVLISADAYIKTRMTNFSFPEANDLPAFSERSPYSYSYSYSTGFETLHDKHARDGRSFGVQALSRGLEAFGELLAHNWVLFSRPPTFVSEGSIIPLPSLDVSSGIPQGLWGGPEGAGEKEKEKGKVDSEGQTPQRTRKGSRRQLGGQKTAGGDGLKLMGVDSPMLNLLKDQKPLPRSLILYFAVVAAASVELSAFLGTIFSGLLYLDWKQRQRHRQLHTLTHTHSQTHKHTHSNIHEIQERKRKETETHISKEELASKALKIPLSQYGKILTILLMTWDSSMTLHMTTALFNQSALITCISVARRDETVWPAVGIVGVALVVKFVAAFFAASILRPFYPASFAAILA